MTMKQAAIFLVSALPADRARKMGFRPFACVEDAAAAALQASGPDPFVVVMPEGGSVLPAVAAPGGAAR
jgi:nickel-dependent lactate racemase